MTRIEKIQTELRRIYKRGTNATVLALPVTGKTHLIRKAIQEISPEYNTHSIYLNTGDLLSDTEIDFLGTLVIEMLLSIDDKSIAKDAKDAISSQNSLLILDSLKKVTKELIKGNSKVRIIIDDLSRLANSGTSLFNMLRALQLIDKRKISYLLVDAPKSVQILDRETTDSFHEVFSSKFIYLPLPTKEEYKPLLQEFMEEFDTTLDEETSNNLWEWTKGIIGLLKYSVQAIADNPDLATDYLSLVKYPALQTRLKKIVEALPADAIKEIRRGNLKTSEKELKQLGVTTKGSVIPMLMTYIVENYSLSREDLDIATESRIITERGHIFVDGVKVENVLSSKEFRVISHLIKNRGSIVSREEVAKEIWKENLNGKYSDWAIDQTISRLRKKIGDNAYKPVHIKTIRGRGFMLQS